MYKGQSMILPVVVVKDNGRRLPASFGRNWLERLKLDWREICHATAADIFIISLIKKYPAVFAQTLGTVKNFEAKVSLNADALPVFSRARSVPFSLKKVEEQLREMVKAGMLQQEVLHSGWATPLVLVHKKDGSLRLCTDYKVTIIPVSKTDHYPLPRPEDLYSAITGDMVFYVLDQSAAYQQVPLSPESRSFLSVHTSLGLLHFQRLPYGVAIAPAIFQSLMDKNAEGHSSRSLLYR